MDDGAHVQVDAPAPAAAAVKEADAVLREGQPQPAGCRQDRRGASISPKQSLLLRSECEERVFTPDWCPRVVRTTVFSALRHSHQVSPRSMTVASTLSSSSVTACGQAVGRETHPSHAQAPRRPNPRELAALRARAAPAPPL